MIPSIIWQPSLFAADPPAIDTSFSSLVRHQLDASTWVDHAPGWLQGSEAVLDPLLAADWQAARPGEPWHVDPASASGAEWLDDIRAMTAALASRYGVTFDRGDLTLYRHGRDVLPWSQHASGSRFTNPVVATVSFGARRTLKLRSRDGGGTTAFALQPGDLFVMGGASQHTWEHAVARAVRVRDPRVVATFTHSHVRS